MLVPIILSLGALDALVPVVIIVILIAAAAGLSRGTDLFALFGVGALIGMAGGFGGGRGGAAANRLRYNNQQRRVYNNALVSGARVGAIAGGKMAIGGSAASMNYSIAGRNIKLLGSIPGAGSKFMRTMPGSKNLLRFAADKDKQNALNMFINAKNAGRVNLATGYGMATAGLTKRAAARNIRGKKSQIPRGFKGDAVFAKQWDKERMTFDETLKAKGIAPLGIGLRRPSSWFHPSKAIAKANKEDMKAVREHTLQQAYRVRAKDSSGNDIRGDLSKLGKQIEAFRSGGQKRIQNEAMAAAEGKNIVELGNLILSLKAYQMNKLTDSYNKVRANEAKLSELESKLYDQSKSLSKAQETRLNNQITSVREEIAKIEKNANLTIKQSNFAILNTQDMMDQKAMRYQATSNLSNSIKNASMLFAMRTEIAEPGKVLGAGLGLLASNIASNINNPQAMIKSSNEILRGTAETFIDTTKAVGENLKNYAFNGQMRDDMGSVAGKLLSAENIGAELRMEWHKASEIRAQTAFNKANPYDAQAQKLAAQSYDNIRVEFLDYCNKGGDPKQFRNIQDEHGHYKFREQYDMMVQEANFFNSQHPDKSLADRVEAARKLSEKAGNEVQPKMTTGEQLERIGREVSEEFLSRYRGTDAQGGNGDESAKREAADRIRKVIEERQRQAEEQRAAQDRQRAFRNQVENAGKRKPPFGQ